MIGKLVQAIRITEVSRGLAFIGFCYLLIGYDNPAVVSDRPFFKCMLRPQLIILTLVRNTQVNSAPLYIHLGFFAPFLLSVA